MQVILDGDPGHDDAVSWLLALASPELTVMGVTTTHGNVGLARTTLNARRVLALAGRQVPLYAGADRPLLRPAISAESVHGASGLDGPDLPEPGPEPEALHAAQFMVETVLARPHEVTIVPTGPLTNLALALRLEPRLAGLIQGVVWMGGSLSGGNWSPAAEFNALADPHAARIVFEAAAQEDLKLAMFGLDVTHQAIATPARVAAFRALGTRVGEVTARLLEFFAEHHRERYGWEGGALHDPMTVAYLLRPELFQLRPLSVQVDTTEGPGLGQTIADWWKLSGQAPNAKVALQVDADGFFKLLVERIGQL